VTQILRLSLPLTLWLIGFCALYALQGLSCSRHWPDALDPRTALIFAAALFVAFQAITLVAVLRSPAPSRFVQMVTASLAATALVAAFWTSLPVLAVTICG
jgi:hypothetical protein